MNLVGDGNWSSFFNNVLYCIYWWMISAYMYIMLNGVAILAHINFFNRHFYIKLRLDHVINQFVMMKETEARENLPTARLHTN